MKKILIAVVLFEILVFAEPLRYEMSGNFVASEEKAGSKTNSVLLKPEAMSDIPELFEQKTVESTSVSGDSTLTEINGFRLQIFKTEDLIEAKKRESMYIENFGEENVVLIYEKPFYKIRVGRLRSREEASDLQEALCRRGMCNSIIIPDLVNVLMPSKKNKE
jgi:hypothetical protein